MIRNEQIGQRISELLKEKNLKQVDITDSDKVKSSHLNHIITGKSGASLELLQLICNRLNVTLSDFFAPFYGNEERVPSYVREFFSLCDGLSEDFISILSSTATQLQVVQKKQEDLPPVIGRKSSQSFEPHPQTICFPVMGESAAGLPLFSSVDDNFISVPARFADPDRYLAVRVRGDSMEPKIKNHGVVIAQRGLTPSSGQAALVCLAGMADDEYTIKRVYPDGGGLVLRSYNKAYSDMTYSWDDLRSCDAIVHVINPLDD